MEKDVIRIEAKFKKNHQMVIDGKEFRFKPDDFAEIELEEFKRLLKAGVVVPGPQHGGVVVNQFSK